jgi:hypothetical protein
LEEKLFSTAVNMRFILGIELQIGGGWKYFDKLSTPATA